MAVPRPPLPSTTAIPLPPRAYWHDDSSSPGALRGLVMDAPLDLKPFVKYFIAPIIMLALALSVFHFLHLPPVIVKSHVTHASLTEFNFIQSSNDTISLHYNLAFNITFRNPN
ncbi:NDR1/HIN1-like protein 10 [Rosa chinensis]|uniref:NDR1/HIN1-like protein 10 n=1 Tax=Rosa chinensis TaxID=74649 RepID=UPI000D08F72B|nr:NDR1/HIN1-like protein 10 [Rosa chinensis]